MRLVTSNPTSIETVDFLNGKSDKQRILRRLNKRMEYLEQKLIEAEYTREAAFIEAQMHELCCVIDLVEKLQ